MLHTLPNILLPLPGLEKRIFPTPAHFLFGDCDFKVDGDIPGPPLVSLGRF